jgi:hypothetical protein
MGKLGKSMWELNPNIKKKTKYSCKSIYIGTSYKSALIFCLILAPIVPVKMIRAETIVIIENIIPKQAQVAVGFIVMISKKVLKILKLVIQLS